MTDKKTFGAFIKSRRIEKNYSQKELAELLFVTEGAISKWERGASYPDITLIGDICRVLDISEHEFLTASTDTSARKVQKEAQKFRTIRGVWFWIPTIAYPLALLICLICNLAVNHTLSWFFIVLAALLCAYSFIPTFTLFVRTHKLQVFVATSFLAICLLLFTCGVYTQSLFWVPTACVGVLMGYVAVFLPIMMSRTRYKRYGFLAVAVLLLVLTVLLLLTVRTYVSFPLPAALAITGYNFLPVLFCALICLLRKNGFWKAGVSTLFGAVVYVFTALIVEELIGTTKNHYRVDFHNWAECINGNIHCLTFISLVLIGAVLLAIGLKIRKRA
ncbi:MAG: helix-turn-helix transcriptional regulator [Oscillospiraceae bacterium]|nr:helix-turn-helix transcriptional regulator [Oscillospiraceae bacterium]